MATQVQARPIPQWGNKPVAPSNLISQLMTLLARPHAFFQKMPHTGQWVFIAMLTLCIAGFTAANQLSQGQSSTTTSNTQTTAFNVSLLQGGSAASSSQTNTSTNSSTQPTTNSGTSGSSAAASTQQASSVDTNTLLISAVTTASGVLVMWAGQAILLCLVPMLHGYAPQFRRNLQIAVWASLPLALMLALRQANFAMGGTGGAMGLSLLLTQWSDYTKIGQIAQRIIAVFMSNISLFWLWSMALFYLGARHALNGKRWSVILVMVMWIVTSTVVPALVSNPVTTTAPRVTASTSTTSTTQKANSTSSSSTASQQQMGAMGGVLGEPPMGMPSGGGPQGAPGGSSSSSR